MAFRYNLTSTSNTFVLKDDSDKRFVDPQIQNAVHVDLEMEHMRKYRPTGDITISTNEIAIKQSVTNIIATNRMEMTHLPDFGAGLVANLFENITSDNADSIQEKITVAIRRWEPRVSVKAVTVKPIPENNSYDVDVSVIILSTSESVNLQDTLTVTRIL